MEHYSAEWEIGKIYSTIQNGELVALRDNSTVGFLVCSALDLDGINRAFKLKGKDQSNPLVLYCSSLSMVQKFSNPAEFTHQAYCLCEQLWPSMTITILPTSRSIPDAVCCGEKATGFCCPTSRFLRQLSSLLQAPLVLIAINIDVIDAKSEAIGALVEDVPALPSSKAIIIDCRKGLRRIDDHYADALELPDIIVRQTGGEY